MLPTFGFLRSVSAKGNCQSIADEGEIHASSFEQSLQLFGFTFDHLVAVDVLGEPAGSDVCRVGLDSLDGFLSRCLLAGIGDVRIMHGVGTGRLSQFVRDYLRSTPYVANVRQADTHDGGVGVTLADIV